MLSTKSFFKIIIAVAISFISLPSFADMDAAPESAALSGNSTPLDALGISIPTGLVTPDWNSFLKLGIEQMDSKRLRDILPISFPASADPKKALMAVFQRDPDAFSVAVSYLAGNIDPKGSIQDSKLHPEVLNLVRRALIVQADFIDSWQKELSGRFSLLQHDVINNPTSLRTLVALHLCIDQSNRLFRGLDIFLHRDTIRELRAAQTSAKESAKRITMLRAVMEEANIASGDASTHGIRVEVLPHSIIESNDKHLSFGDPVRPTVPYFHDHLSSFGSFNYTYTNPTDYSKLEKWFNAAKARTILEARPNLPSVNGIQYLTHTLSPEEVERLRANIAQLIAQPVANNFRRDTLPVFRVTFDAEVPMPPARMPTRLIRPFGLTLFQALLYQRLLYHTLSGIVSDFYYYASGAKLSLLQWLYNSIGKNRFQAFLFLTGGISAAISLGVLALLPIKLGLALAASGLVLMIPIVKNRILRSLYWKTFWQSDTFEDAS